MCSQKFLYIPLSYQSLSEWLLETSFCHHVFTSFDCVIIQINTNFLTSQKINFFYIIDLTSVLYFQKDFPTLSRRSFPIYPLFTIFLQVSGMDEACNISDVYHLPDIDIFTQETRYLCSSFPRRFGALNRKSFLKHPLFPTSLLLLTRLRCVIFEINSDFLLSQHILIFLHVRPNVSPSFPKVIAALFHRRF